jgi:ribose transport system substrate-binding protein
MTINNAREQFGRCGKLGAYVTAVVAATGALAACGSSTHTSGKISAAAVAQATALVNQYKAIPTWNGPKAPLNVSKAKGKTVFIVTQTFQVPFLKVLNDQAVEALHAAGLNTVSVDGQNSPATMNTGFQEALSRHVAAIIMNGITASDIQPAINSAAAQHIPVVTMANDSTQFKEPAGISANVSVNYETIGQLMIAYAVEHNTNGKVDIVAFNLPDHESTAEQKVGELAELKALCPTVCKFKSEHIEVATFPQTIPATVQADLRADPNINWVMPDFDAATTYAIPAINQIGFGSKVSASSNNAIESNLKFIATGNVQKMSVGQDDGWWAWATADETLRLILGQPVVAENVPQRLVDLAVINQSGGVKNIGNADALFGNTPYRTDYRKLWGL